MTDYDWIVGDVLQHPDGRAGLVIGCLETTVKVRLPKSSVEEWPADALRGTGLWLKPTEAGDWP